MIRYTSGQAHIAFEVLGSGKPDLLVIPAISHLQYDWATSAIRAFYEHLSAHRRVIRYDRRGMGLSGTSTGPADFAVDRQAADALAVLDELSLPSVAIFAWHRAAAISLHLAALHPKRVSHLVLYGAYARSAPWSGYPHNFNPRRVAALRELLQTDRELGARALAASGVPESDPETATWYAVYLQLVMSPQLMSNLTSPAADIDVRKILPLVRVPTFVMHRRDDRVIPFAAGMALAENLPNAMFLELSGEPHQPFLGDSLAVTKAIDRFLYKDPAQPKDTAPLTEREIEILRLMVQGLTNREIGLRLTITTGTVGRHMANIYGKLGCSTRTAAVVYALRHGIGDVA